MTDQWYCAGFIKQKEALAVQHLERQDYTVFCPRLRKTVSHARQKKSVLSPLFPGYLFIQLDIDVQRWRPIDGTIGVTHLIKNGSRPTPVPWRFMEMLLSGADENGIVSFADSLQPGDQVRTIGGPLDGQIGTLLKLKDADRVVVLMSMLGGRVPVTVPRGQLIKASFA